MGYVPPVTTLMRWFADRRGLATGLAVGGFGIGALITSFLAPFLLKHMSVSATFIALGLIYWPILFLASRVLRLPEEAGAASHTPTVSLTAAQTLRLSRFWLLWGAFFVNICTGILLIALARPLLEEMMNFSMQQAVLTVAMMGLLNGLGRLIWSAASDRVGRTNTWLIMLVLQMAMFAILCFTGSGLMFAVGICLIASCYGGGFAICPAMVGDIFGPASAARVYGLSLTAWSAAALLSPPVTAWVKEATGSYRPILIACTVASVLGMLLIVVLRGMTKTKAPACVMEVVAAH
jgi:OFA family oxalate/formate antiporter-like MFS transporter